MNNSDPNSKNNSDLIENDLSLCFIPKHILCDTNLNQTEKLLFGRFNSLWRQGKPCYLSNNTLAKEFGLSPRMISKHINSMVKKGYIFTHLDNNYVNTTRFIIEFYNFVDIQEALSKTAFREKFKKQKLKNYIVSLLIDFQMELKEYDYRDAKQLDNFIQNTPLLRNFEKSINELRTLNQIKDLIFSSAQKKNKRPDNLGDHLDAEYDYLIDEYLQLE